MRRRLRTLVPAALALVLFALLVDPTTHFAIVGLIQGEAFFDNRPTSYWAGAIRHDPFVRSTNPGDVGRRLREGGARATPVLSELVALDDEDVRLQALLALSQMDQPAPGAVSALRELLCRSENALQLHLAGRCLLASAGDEAAESCADAVRRNHSAVGRVNACACLARLGPRAASAVPVLQPLLDDPSPAVQEAAAVALWYIERRAEPVVLALATVPTLPPVPALLPGPSVSAGAAASEGGPGAGAPGTLGDAALNWFGLDRLKDQAWRELAATQPDVLDFVREGMKAAVDVDRCRALAAFGALRRGSEFLDHLTAAARDPAASVRRTTALLLPEGRAAVDEELRLGAALLRDPILDVRRAAVLGVSGFAPEPRIAALLAEALADASPEVRRQAALAFSRTHQPVDTVAEKLLAALDDEYMDVRSSAAAGLGCSRAPTPRVLRALAGKLRDPAGRVRSAAVEALRALGSRARPVVPELVEALGLPECRRQAALALAFIDPSDSRVLATLAEFAELPGMRFANTDAAVLQLMLVDAMMRGLVWP